MFKPIKTAPQLSQAIMSTYLIDGIVIVIIFIAIMLIIVKLVQWQPGKNDRSGAVRRAWFFSLMSTSLISCLTFDYFAWFRYISVPAFASKYTLHMIIASIVAALVYFIIGFVLVKLAPIGTKLQSIFPKKDR